MAMALFAWSMKRYMLTDNPLAMGKGNALLGLKLGPGSHSLVQNAHRALHVFGFNECASGSDFNLSSLLPLPTRSKASGCNNLSSSTSGIILLHNS